MHRNREMQEHDDLLVFGYACRLYNPTETTGDIGERHLISWNDDDTLKIDRYDCRLYLHSLSEFDKHVPLKNDTDDCSAEALEEEMCDEERYRDLYDDMRRVEEEEATKRGKRAEIGFSYDTPSAPPQAAPKEEESSSSEEEIEEAYEVPEGVKLPVGLEMPKTKKQSAIINKTAGFVVAQGPQMEIVIKAKQRKNLDQFAFLEFDNVLNPYYKYICKLIREKKYTPVPHQPKTRPKLKKILRMEAEKRRAEANGTTKPSGALAAIAEAHGSDSESGSDDENYLHPSLLGGSRSDSKEPSPAVGPLPRPEPKESPEPDLEAILKRDYTLKETHHIYSSLFKNLSSLLPNYGQKPAVEAETPKEEEPEKVETEPEEAEPPRETDPAKIADYNRWHLEFYKQVSPYEPNAPYVCMPPPPNLTSALNVAARYVALHGAPAERRLIDHNRGNVEFLHSHSRYYTFYQSRVRYYRWTLDQAYAAAASMGQVHAYLAEPYAYAEAYMASGAARPRPETPTAMYRRSPTMSPKPTVVVTNTDIPDPPRPPSNLIPVEITATTAEPSTSAAVCANFDDKEEAITSELQQERKERARLFMEKILNEKLAAKKRQQEAERDEKHRQEAEKEAQESISEYPVKQELSPPVSKDKPEENDLTHSSEVEHRDRDRRKDDKKKSGKDRKKDKKHRRHGSRYSGSSDDDHYERKRRRHRSCYLQLEQGEIPL
ncbi:Surp module family protein [Aphelenchoides avenae]|nr:Surp module family protein [Aphelenchus avenae]